MSTVLETDTWYWLPDEEHLMIPAKLLSYGGGSAKFELEEGPQLIQRVKTDITLDPLDPQCLDSNISNLIEFKSLSEKSVLHVLRIRFAKDDIYTLVSGILIACNPFKAMPIYDKDTMDIYRHTRDHSTLPPHIFSLANEAYVSMVQTGTPQSIVISGESGAGKTESIKLILKYLARLSEITSNSSKSVQEQILSANPVLEAFGNAKTSRNNNSSRFGKLITVNFSGGVISQASIISYLLEKSRVVHQQAGERNYHVFYQLLAACTADPNFGIVNGLHKSVDEYNYLSDPHSSYLYNMDEATSFSDVETSLEVLGINKGQQKQLFQVVACVLRLGNVHFKAAESADARALIDDIAELDLICDALGLKHSEMKRLLVSRNFGVRSIVTCFFSVQQAKETRDAFSKALYSHLFSWLIKMINLTLSHGNKTTSATGQFIALLDIFGFEKFENNSFEQLLINYCNEKLQFHFNSHIFVMEQEAYKQEGININYVNFKDNSATLSVLERKPTGLLSMIDEEINVPKGSDMSLLNKILNSQDKKDFIGMSKPEGKGKGKSKASSSSPVSSSAPPRHLSSFTMKHYAGEVAYDIAGFLEKNKDTLSQDLAYLGKNSSVPFVTEIFTDFEVCKGGAHVSSASTRLRPVGKRSTAQAKGPTISTQFKKQLTDLIATLNSTSPYFVRCMKTNPQKAGNVFDCNLMLKQLQYSGLLEVCRIRQEGFPCRHDFQGFFCMYRKLNQSSTTGPLLAKDLETKGLYGADDYCIGKNKIFLKYATGQKLEQLRGETINAAAKTCQSAATVFLARQRFKGLLRAYHDLETAAESRDTGVLEAALVLLKTHLPNEGEYLPALREAKVTLARLREEEPVLRQLGTALEKKDFSGMENGLVQARSLSPPLCSPLVAACDQAIKDYLRARMDVMKASSVGMTSSAKKLGQKQAAEKSNSPSLPHDTTLVSMTTKPESTAVSNSHLEKSSSSKNHVPVATTHSSVLKVQTDTVPAAASSNGGSIWGSPSAIRAANGKMAATSSHSHNHSHCDPPAPGPGAGPAAGGISKVVPQAQASVSSPVPVVEHKSQSHVNPADNNHNTTAVDTASTLPESEQIVHPTEDFKSRKRSMLQRQLSTSQIGVAEEVSEMIEVLHELCLCEVGINPDDIKPLEVMLKKISSRDCPVNREIAEMMMAEQELIRAKKQLLLQAAVDKVKSNTPLWKLKNLAHQSRQIGMENYHGCRNLTKIIEGR